MSGNGIEFRMPAPLQLDSVGDMLLKWRNFKQQLKIFIAAAGLTTVTETRKSAILLNCIGQEGLELYYNLIKDSEDTPKFDELLKLFDEYFEPKQNELINTFNFNNRKQEDGETFDNFYIAIRKLVKNCNFKDMEDRMLRDRIVMGIRDRKLQQKLLENKDLTLELAVNKCRVTELSKEHAQVIQKQEPVTVDLVSSRAKHEAKYFNNSKKNMNYSRKFYKCLKCSLEHGPAECPAFGQTCYKCKKLNHFAKGCKSKNIASIEVENTENNNLVHDL